MTNCRSVLPIAAPAAQQRAVKLSGRSVSAIREIWEQIAMEGVPGVAQSDSAEMCVRNVSEATLEIFLPDPSKATGAAMIVAPGGGFIALAIEREGYRVASWLNQRGIAAFVLKYRLAPTPADFREAEQANARLRECLHESMARARTDPGIVSRLFSEEQRCAMREARQDGLGAVRHVRAHAKQYGVSPHRVGMMGFSAGAILAIDVALHADPASRPDVIAPIYGMLPGEAAVPTTAPPAFVAVAADDPLAFQCLAVYEAWRANGAAAELHVFEDGGHGFGVLRQGKSSDNWPEPFDHWLTAHGFRSSTAHLA